MKKLKLTILIMLFNTILCLSQNHKASTINVDSNIVKQMHGLCGYNASTFSDPNARISNNGSLSPLAIAKNLYPANAIFNCGAFRLYYEDIALGTGDGFDDVIDGANRRSTLCAVYQYIQNTFNLTNIPSTDPITIEIQRSFTTLNPPVNSGILATAGPVYPNSTGPGIYNGSLLNHILTNLSPNINLFDAVLQVNFVPTDPVNYAPITYHTLPTLPVPNCDFDLYTILLHEVGHQLGFGSLLGENSSFQPVSKFGNNQYTLYDWQNIWHGNINSSVSFEKIVTGTITNPQINPLILNSTNYLRDGGLWLNNQGRFLGNLPIYSGVYGTWNSLTIGSVASHICGDYLSFTQRFSLSPGYMKPFSMSFSMDYGETRREYTDEEIRIFLNLGYILNPVFSTSNSINGINTNGSIIMSNRAPITTKQTTSPANGSSAFLTFPDLVQTPDFTISNNGTPLVIQLAADPTISDADLDIVKVENNTLFNIRGCSSNGNNHNCLSVNAIGSTITYTPRPNFIGRAQFGFYLHDGKERGSFMVYTIDVLPGTAFINTPNVNTPAGNNEMLVNGDFEEVTEVRKPGNIVSESIISTMIELNRQEGLFFGGVHFSDAHPLQYINWNWTSGGGVIIGNSQKDCSQGVTPIRFGYLPFSFPSPPNWNNPIPINGNSYSYILGGHNYHTLTNPLITCHRYIAHFDVNFANTGLSIGSTYTLNINFHSAIAYPTNPSLQSVPISIVVGTGWQTITVPFVYCSNVPPSFLNFESNGFAYYDNASLIEDLSPAPPLIINATANSSQICIGSNSALTGIATNAFCNTTYNWQPGNLNGASVLVSPLTPTIYTLTVNDGCRTATTTVNVNINPLLSFSLNIVPSQTICSGTSLTLTATSGASTTTTYTWLPGSSNANPLIVTPLVNTTYTVYGTNINSCINSQTISITLIPTPTISALATPTTVCSYNPNTTLTATGGLTYVWNTGATTNPITVSPTSTTVYTVTGTIANGCSNTATVSVNYGPCESVCSIANAPNLTTTSGTVTGATFNLNSPLTLTGDLNLVNVKVFMGSNAEIIIPNGYKLYITQSHLLGCPYMWKGIRCSGTSASVVIANNSLIEDAITAIDVKNVTTPASTGAGVILSFNNSTFNKNYTAVNIASYNSTAGNYPLAMQNTVFTSRKLITPEHVLVTPTLTPTYNWPTANNMANLKVSAIPTNLANPDNQLQTNYEFSVASYSTSNLEYPYINTIAHQGISVQEVYSPTNFNGLRIGAGASTYTTLNVFDNMHYGINGLNANINSSNSAYQYMQQFPVPCIREGKCFKAFDGGVGINSVRDIAPIDKGVTQTFSLTVNPTITGYNVGSNFFLNCAYGVKFTNIEHANIQYAIFHSKRIYTPPSGIGLCCPALPLGEYGVYAKTFSYQNIAINNNFTSNINKAITFIADYSYGLYNATRYQIAGAVNINNNTLKANYGNTLSTRSMEQAIVVDNLLNQTTVAGNVAGTPTIPVFVANNTIDKTFRGISVTNWNSQRVIDNSNYITLVDNLVSTSSQYGISHINNFADNMISNTVIGFANTKLLTTGIAAKENRAQTVWCNSTDNTYSGVTFSGSQNLTNWKENKMKTHIHGMELSNTTIGTQGAVGQPINNVWVGAWPTGTFKTYVKTMDPATTSTLTGTDSKLYLNNPPSVAQNGSFPTFLIRYKTTAPASLLLTSGPGLNCPALTNGGVGTGTVNGMSKFIGNLTNIVANGYEYGTFLNGNRKNGKIATYRALMQDTTLMAGNTILKTFYSTNATSTIGKLTQTETQLSNANVLAAESVVNTIIPTDTVEQNTTRFYQIYINSKLGTYSTTDDADLQTLANACPLKEGVVVYQARVLLNSIYDVYYHYEDNCPTNVSSARLGHSDELNNVIVNNNFIVYPNPSNGTIYFSASNMGIDAYSVTIYDVNGRVIYEKTYTDGTEVNTINLNLSSGVYMMQLIDSNTNDIYKQKIVIQK